ncbi:MAG: hypothetical protein JO007_02870 [Alphaproteobacteria bacterium]|nr:hypothetical protein [Alphaproteobacteria bacterium]
MNSISARDSLPARCRIPYRRRRNEPVRFPVCEHFAEVIETAIQRRDIDRH